VPPLKANRSTAAYTEREWRPRRLPLEWALRADDPLGPYGGRPPWARNASNASWPPSSVARSGNFIDFGLGHLNHSRNAHYNQWLMSKFPTQRNRELIGPYQRIKSAYQGSFFARSGNPHTNAGFSRSGVNGARRRRTPVASKTALAIAAATGRIELSPAPAGGSSGAVDQHDIDRLGRLGDVEDRVGEPICAGHLGAPFL
jgi:hypothetical protein